MKQYDNYNDDELLYLVKEGNEKALEYLFLKYDVYIKKIAYNYYQYGDKKDDLLQEGRMVLYNCMKSYDPFAKTSFFVYFSISLRRRFKKLLSEEYFSGIVLKENEIIYNIPSKESIQSYKLDTFFKDELTILCYQECVIGNTSMKQFCKENNIDYGEGYRMYKRIIQRLKIILTNTKN